MIVKNMKMNKRIFKKKHWQNSMVELQTLVNDLHYDPLKHMCNALNEFLQWFWRYGLLYKRT